VESWHYTSQFTQGDKRTEFLKMLMLPLYFYNSPIFFLGGGYQGGIKDHDHDHDLDLNLDPDLDHDQDHEHDPSLTLTLISSMIMA